MWLRFVIKVHHLRNQLNIIAGVSNPCQKKVTGFATAHFVFWIPMQLDGLIGYTQNLNLQDMQLHLCAPQTFQVSKVWVAFYSKYHNLGWPSFGVTHQYSKTWLTKFWCYIKYFKTLLNQVLLLQYSKTWPTKSWCYNYNIPKLG